MFVFSKNRADLILFACFAVCTQVALAERADKSKPLVFEAESGRVDELRRTTVLTGKVILSKGTLLIKAGRVELKEDGDGYQKGLAFAEPKGRVFFKQKREGVDETIEAEAELMDYDERADTVTFSRSAVFRTYRASVLANEVFGSSIVYDSKAESFSVDGGVPVIGAGSTGGASGTRFRGMIVPKAAAAGASGSGPAVLRMSGEIKVPAR